MAQTIGKEKALLFFFGEALPAHDLRIHQVFRGESNPREEKKLRYKTYPAGEGGYSREDEAERSPFHAELSIKQSF